MRTILKHAAYLLLVTSLFSCKKHKDKPSKESIIDTLALAPANNPEELQIGIYNGKDQSGHGTRDLPVEAWTKQSLPFTVRAVIKFDFGSIPSNATIRSAKLFLYSDPTPVNGNFVDANFGTNNSMLIQQVAADWSPLTLNWGNQPEGLTANQIVIPSTTSSFLDLEVDVTEMVKSMVTNNSNYGFLLKLENEVTYTCRIFGSSLHPDPTKYPKLEIIFQKN